MCEPLHVSHHVLCGQLNLRASYVAYIDVSIISAGCKPACSYSGVMESEAMGLFTVESVTTFARRCGQVLSGSMEPLRGH